MWNSRKLNKKYLTKMLDKQVEMKEDLLAKQRDENLKRYLEDIKEKPSVNKKVLFGGRAWNKKS